MDAVTQDLAEVGAEVTVAYEMRDLPGVIAALTPLKAKEHGVAMIVEAHLRGDYFTCDLAMAVSALRDVLAAGWYKAPQSVVFPVAPKAPEVNGRIPFPAGSSSVPRGVLEYIASEISRVGYARLSNVRSRWKLFDAAKLVDHGFEQADISLHLRNKHGPMDRLVSGVIVAVGATCGPRWTRIGGGA